MIDHLVFEQKNWFDFNPDAENQTLAGKQVYTAPPKVKVIDSSSNQTASIGMAYPRVYDGIYDVVGVGTNYYIIKCNGVNSVGSFSNEDCIISKKYCTPIWGG